MELEQGVEEAAIREDNAGVRTCLGAERLAKSICEAIITGAVTICDFENFRSLTFRYENPSKCHSVHPCSGELLLLVCHGRSGAPTINESRPFP